MFVAQTSVLPTYIIRQQLSKLGQVYKKTYEDKHWRKRISLQRYYESMESILRMIRFWHSSWPILIPRYPTIGSYRLRAQLTPEFALNNGVNNSGQEITLEQIKTKFLQECSRQREVSNKNKHWLLEK